MIMVPITMMHDNGGCTFHWLVLFMLHVFSIRAWSPLLSVWTSPFETSTTMRPSFKICRTMLKSMRYAHLIFVILFELLWKLYILSGYQMSWMMYFDLRLNPTSEACLPRLCRKAVFWFEVKVKFRGVYPLPRLCRKAVVWFEVKVKFRGVYPLPRLCRKAVVWFEVNLNFRGVYPLPRLCRKAGCLRPVDTFICSFTPVTFVLCCSN